MRDTWDCWTTNAQPDIFGVLAKIRTGERAHDARLGIAMDAAVAFGMYLAKTNQGGAEQLNAEQVAALFFQKAARL